MTTRQLVSDLLALVRIVVAGGFVALALMAVVRARRLGRSGWWVAAAFGAIAIALLADFAPEASIGPWQWSSDVRIGLIVAFPYLLLRFTASFRALPSWIEAASGVGLAGLVVATLAMPALPEGSAARPTWLTAYIAAVLAYWVLVSLVTVLRLWAAGRGQPTVARRRMRLMSVATAILAVALLMAGQLAGVSDLARLAVLVVALAGVGAFGLGFSPPLPLRLVWRRSETAQLQTAMITVLGLHTRQEVAHDLLPPTVRLVGGSGAALVDAAGRTTAVYGQVPAPFTDAGGRDSPGVTSGAAGRQECSAPQRVPLGEGLGELLVWTSRYTPFFADEEVGLLRSMGAVAGLALQRCSMLEEERYQRTVLEQARRDAEAAREEASRADAAKTGFLSRMSHELRTPLNAILGFGQLLELSELNHDDRDAVQHILKAGQHLLALINDVLDLSRVDAGTLTISPEPVHAGELVNDTLALIRPMAETRGIRVSSKGQACDAYVRTDRQRCRQVLLNLLSNAVKYNRDGGKVDVQCEQVDAETLRISVADTGPGIDPLHQTRLFEPFQRLGAEASDVEGTGLGLALTKQLVERLGGAIGVNTASGAGSTFWVDLPVTQGPDQSLQPIPSGHRRNPPVGERRLLLVEDNLANLRLVEAVLRHRPEISVLPAMQGRLAVDLARQHRPDVIVLDLHLPDLPGRDVLLRLLADPLTRDIPVVIASADASTGAVERLLDSGAYAYITKPIDLQRFLTVIDQAIGQRNTAT